MGKMRVLFLLLVLANFAFFAWDRYLRTPVNPAAHIQQVQMAPEKIRLVNASAPRASVSKPLAPAEALKVDGVEKAEVACLAWGAFIGPQDAARADAAMAEARLPAAQVKRVLTDVDGHWVLIPPQKSQADVARVVDNLKNLGITDYSIVPEPPRWRNAVSLGIFRTEETARTLLAEVKKQGVSDVVVAKRERFFQQMTYYVREPDEATITKLTALRSRVAGSEVKALACPEQFEEAPNK